MDTLSHYVLMVMVGFIFLSMITKGFFPHVKVTKKRTASEIATWLVVYLALPAFVALGLMALMGHVK